MKKIKNWIKSNLFLLICTLPMIIILGSFITIEIYVWVTYGKMPLDEIPLWALIFMFRRR